MREKWAVEDVWGDPILKPHEEFARDVGRIAHEVVLRDMAHARISGCDSHVRAWRRANHCATPSEYAAQAAWDARDRIAIWRELRAIGQQPCLNSL